MKITKIIVVAISGIFLLGMLPNLSLNMNAKAETWTQSTNMDFNNGESIGVKVEDGNLKLDFAPVLEWSDEGEASLNYFGYSTSNAGDVNGDGYDDVIVGAYRNSDAGNNAGKAYVYHGSISGLSPTPDWSVTGESAEDYFGYSVSTAGDLNGDGYDDVIVGAYKYGGSDNGKAYLFNGSSSGLLNTYGWSKEGEAAYDKLGYCVDGGGDVNDDSFDDIIIGAPWNGGSNNGEAYVYHGSSSGPSETPDWSNIGENSNDEFGTSVSNAGDVNGDGYDDVIVGAIKNDDGGTWAGKSYVYHGSASGLSPTPDWSDQGEAAQDQFGFSVSSAGDVNGDSYDDVIVGAIFNDGAALNAGEIYIYHGSATGLSLTPDWSDLGEAMHDHFGNSISSLGDVNKDGYDDIIIGARYNDDSANDAGKVYLYSGSNSGISSHTTWSVNGESSGDSFGLSVSTAGDVNRDGYDDFIIGAPNSGGSSNNGKAYVYQYNDEQTFNLMERWNDDGEDEGDWFGDSVACAGDVNKDGYDDVIVGAVGNDDGGSDAGEAYVYHGSTSGLGSIPDWSDRGEAVDDGYGKSVASAGDVNGDGYDDVIVGAEGNDDGGSDAGEAYVYHGSSSGLSSSPDWDEQGAAGDYFGSIVSSAGDVNGDGFDDVIIGAPFNSDAGSETGKVYGYYGSSSGLSSTPDWSDLGEANGDYFGEVVATAGDVNGDGYDDVIIGARENDDGPGDTAGKSYVYHGSATGLSTNPDWTEKGEADGDQFGFYVSSAGDVNEDGFDDVIIGAPYNDDGGLLSGKAYIYMGSDSGLRSYPGWKDVGEGLGDYFGNIVAHIGDINMDGFDDVAVYGWGGVIDDSEVYIYFGSATGPGSSPDLSLNMKVTSIAFGGDVNGDSYIELLLGNSFKYESSKISGKAYVYMYPDYLESGTFISEAFSVTGDHSVDFRYIKWNPLVQPDGTSVKIQVGISNDGGNWDFYGPDGTENSYFTQPQGEDIPNTLKGKYWCYKVILESTVPTYTPIIDEVIITYAKYEIPTVQLYSPNGGEDLIKEKHHAITWEVNGDFGSNPINLYFSTDSGSTWSLITSDISNTGMYNWTVPDIETATGAIKVTCIDIYGNNVSDISDITFAIDPPPTIPVNEHEQETEKTEEKKDEQIKNTDETDNSEEELTENTQKSKNQKTWSTISLFIAISEGFVIIFILIMIILIKRKSKVNKKEEKTKEVKK